MIVQRSTFKVKQGCMEELVALNKSEREKEGLSCRIYSPNKAPHGTLVIEWEFESLAESEKYWAGWWAKPETAAFVEEWYALTESGGSTEIWNLE
ncbi:MAG: hypothetical protein E3J25_02210 [Anaerolineales bacterium]|nr:MAG: hypothetical protein E3J25_02210 [Anaerolineales bacterium]